MVRQVVRAKKRNRTSAQAERARRVYERTRRNHGGLQNERENPKLLCSEPVERAPGRRQGSVQPAVTLVRA